MHSKSGWKDFVIPGILVGIVLGACTYEAPTSGNPSGGGGTNQVASSSSGSGTSSVGSGQGGTGGQTSSSSGGDVVSSSSGSTGSSSSSGGEAGSSSSSSASSSGSGVIGVDCGGGLCKAGFFCCEVNNALSCNDPMVCETMPTFFCDGKEDCNGIICCKLDTTASCKMDCNTGTPICNDDTDCPNGGQCNFKYGSFGECPL